MPAPSAISLLVPRLKGLLIFPGTASTSLPCSAALTAVISDPLVSPASMTVTTSDNAEIILFLMGNLHGLGSVPGGYSDTMSPLSHIVL